MCKLIHRIREQARSPIGTGYQIGLHLGLGGGQKGSHHLDLIFASGVLALDDKPVFDGTFAF